MKVPQGYTEEQVLQAIEKVVNILAKNFTFGYHDVDDIKQQGRLYALDVLEKNKFDASRPLANFLYTHVKNRFLNLIRDKYHRNDAPCQACHEGNFCTDSGPCHKYTAWSLRNRAKANIARPLDLNYISDEKENRTRVDSSVEADVEIDEMVAKIDRELPVELRSAYLQMKDGVSVPKAKRRQVEEAVKEILRECLNGDE